MYCKNCGAELPEGAKFCDKCGAPVDSTAGDSSTGGGTAASKVDHFIDKTADEIGDGIDDAFADLKNGFKRSDSTENAGNSSGGNGQDQKKKNRFTPENIEKFAAVSLLFPLFMLIGLGIINGISSWLFGMPLLPDMTMFFWSATHVIYLIVRAVFVIFTALGTVAMLYTVFSSQETRTTWGFIAACMSVLGFAAVFGSMLYWNHVALIILMIITALYGVDLISIVLIQKDGIQRQPDPGEDLKAYKTAYDNYKATHSSESDAAEIKAPSRFEGHGGALLGYYLLYILLSFITFGIATAWVEASIMRWTKKNSVIDGRRLKFNGSGGSLLGHWIIWNILSVITFGIYNLFRHVAMLKWEVKHTYYDGERGAEDSAFDGNTLQYIGYSLVAILLAIPTLGLAYPWTQTMIIRWETKHTVINGTRLAYDGTAVGLLVQYIVVYLLSIVTLGIYVPWGQVRMKRYIMSHTHEA